METSSPHFRTAADLGRALRNLRESRGISLRTLAKQISVSPATLSGIERGMTRLSTDRYQKIADALGSTWPQVILNAPYDQPTVDNERAANRAALRALRETTDWRDYQIMHVGPVLLAASAVFADVGYAGATMRTIADAANISVSGIYHHYESKQQLLVELVEMAMIDLERRFELVLKQTSDPFGRLHDLAECLACFHARRSAFGLLFLLELNSLEGGVESKMRNRLSALYEQVDTTVQDGITQGIFAPSHPDSVSRAIISLCTSLSLWYRRTVEPLTPHEISRQYADMALDLVNR